MTRKSSVSPIPEEALDPRMRGGSLASSGAFPSSWGSGPAESEILGAYLDDRSDNGHQSGPVPQDENATLVRQASLGKRGKPSLRTIQKSNPPSYAPPEQPEPPRAPLEPSPFPMAYKEDTKTQEHGGNATRFRDSSSSVSSDSSHEVDLEKAPVFLDVPQKGLDANQTANPSTEALEKEMEVLPSVGPNMSGRRPGGRRPPRLDMDAVRDAEARGSLTSLPDLIRRATKLASRLDHGRTASRTNLCDEGNQPKPPFAQRLRNSGTLSDILASFPTPAPGNSEGRSSWPVFFKRSNLRNIQSHDSLSPGGRNRRQRRCCGMSPFVFILVCVVILIIIALAVLLPVFLVAVPNENASDKSPCEKSTPCKNGGVSVSSGDNCSCVCANGYTGSQCTIEGDASCVTTEVNEKNATVGSELPRLLEDSQSTFGIPLDSFTLMALFSQNNVSCMTENALVSFQDVHSKSRRSIARSEPLNLEPMYNEPPSPPTTTEIPIPTLAPRSNAATMDGIVYDGSASTENIPTTTSSPTATETTPSESTSSSTPTSTSTSTPSPVSNKVVDFSRIAVLYIFQQTGALDAAMHSEEDIQSYLQDEYSSSKDKQFGMDLHRFGASSNFTVNFDRFTISMDNWTVGGNRE